MHTRESRTMSTQLITASAGSMSNKYSNSSEDTVIGKFSLVSKK